MSSRSRRVSRNILQHKFDVAKAGRALRQREKEKEPWETATKRDCGRRKKRKATS
jgi:hypothetical protein